MNCELSYLRGVFTLRLTDELNYDDWTGWWGVMRFYFNTDGELDLVYFFASERRGGSVIDW